MIRLSVATAIAGGLFLAMTIPSFGQEFRIETELYSGKDREPFAENLTLFTSGRVYDFPLVGPEEITIFDYVEGRFIILAPAQHLKTTVATKEILEFLAKILTEASTEEAPLIHPNFSEEFDDETKWLTLTDPHVVYRAKGVIPDDKEVAAEYKRFADWYARLNSIRPGNLPPFARLELNKALESRNMIPERVELAISPKGRLATGKIEFSSRHIVTYRLLETDHKRIDRATEYWGKYKPVDYAEFVKQTEEAEDAAPR